MAGLLRVGIVGCGSIAKEHLRAYGNVPDVRVEVVFDVSEPAAHAFASANGIRVASTLMDLCQSVDLVSVCTPPGSRLESCLPLLEAQVPVLCEKPLAVSTAEALKLANCAQKNEVILMPAFCHRFHPSAVMIKRMISAGVLGSPLFFRNFFGGYVNIEGNHRSDRQLSGGGCLVDNGVHAIDLFRHLAGEPQVVQAMTGNIRQRTEVEDFCLVHLATADGIYGEIASSYSINVLRNAVEWYGTEGTAWINYFAPGQPELSFCRKGDSRVEIVDCSGLPDRFTAEISHFIDCVRGRCAPAITAEDGFLAARISDAAYASATEGVRKTLS